MAGIENFTDQTELASVTPPHMPRAGDVQGNYKLIKQLGTGGMGSVFLAEHVSIGRKVAMKFLLPELCQYPDIVGRFFDEARSVNRINHENIVEVADFVREPSGLSYLVMELLDGTDLYQTRKGDGPYAVDRILVISEQIANALFGAHRVGIVHRDLKPENVFLIKKRGTKDFVKLLDFGLAKLSDQLPVARMPTQAGIVMGTPGYMSPEQAHGNKIDGRSDIFSLGVLIHWMLCDKVPEGGPNSLTPAQSVRGDDIPDPLRELINSCIRHKPTERPQSMGDVFETLSQLRREIRGTEVLQVVPRAGSPSRTKSAADPEPPTVLAPSRVHITEELTGAKANVSAPAPAPAAPPGLEHAIEHTNAMTQARAVEDRPIRPSTRLLLLVGLCSAGAAFALVGVAYLLFRSTPASLPLPWGADRPPEEQHALAPPVRPQPPPAQTSASPSAQPADTQGSTEDKTHFSTPPKKRPVSKHRPSHP